MAKKHSASPGSGKKSRSSPPKDIDWTDVTDPDERRRIQNRIAQRKFREKTRENKEKAERDSRNLENAGNIYRIPSASDLSPRNQVLSGLPWGCVDFGLVMARSHDSSSRRSSGRGTFTGDEAYSPGCGTSGGESSVGAPSSYNTGPGVMDYGSPVAPVMMSAMGGIGGAGLFYGQGLAPPPSYASPAAEAEEPYYDEAYVYSPAMNAYPPRYSG